MRALAAEGIFLSGIRKFRGWKNVPQRQKPDRAVPFCGTAEAVPFQDAILRLLHAGFKAEHE